MRIALILAFAAAPCFAVVPVVTLGVLLGTCAATSGVVTMPSCSFSPVPIIEANGQANLDTTTYLLVAGDATPHRIASFTSTTITLATAPTVTGTKNIYKMADGWDNSSIRIFFTADQGCFGSVSYTLVSGSYGPPPPGRSYQGDGFMSKWSISVASLPADTDVYFRPDCATAYNDSNPALFGYGTEFMIRTAPSVGIVPTRPAPPNIYHPPTIDTTGYTTVRIPSFADGTITATSNTGTTVTVNTTTGVVDHSWIVIAGMTCAATTFLRTPACQVASHTSTVITLEQTATGTATGAVSYSLLTINEFTNNARTYHWCYGTIVEFDQGYKYPWVSQNQGNGSFGVNLGGLAPDGTSPCPPNPDCPAGVCTLTSVAHRRIIFRTKRSPGTLPPIGVRMSPAYSTILGGVTVQDLPAIQNSGSAWVFDATGAFPPHHYATQQLEFGMSPEGAVGKPDPQPILSLIGATGVTNPPQYNDIDGVLISVPTPQTRQLSAVSLVGSNVSLRNSYLKSEGWRPYQPLANQCSNGTNTIVVLGQTFKANRDDTGIVIPNTTYTFTNSSGYTGRVYLSANTNGLLNLFYAAPTGGETVSVGCSGGCGTQTQATVDGAGPHPNVWGAMTLPVCGVVRGASNTWSELYNFPDTNWPGFTEGTYTVTAGGNGPASHMNSYIEGYGINWFLDYDSITQPADFWQWRNIFIALQDHRVTSATWNGYNYLLRNLNERKQMKRELIEGNIFDGNWANVNQGAQLLLSGRFSVYGNLHNGFGDGVLDTEIRFNTFRNGPASIYVQGGNVGHPGTDSNGWGGDPILTNRTYIHDNQHYDMNELRQQVGSVSGFLGEYYRLLGGPQNVTIDHETNWDLLAGGAKHLFLGGGAPAGRVSVANSIVSLNVGTLAGTGGFLGDINPSSTNYSYLPAFLDTNYAVLLATTTPNLGGVSISYYLNNVIVGGLKADGTSLSSGDMTAYANPSGIYYNSLAAAQFFAAGATKAARQAAVGVINQAANDFRLSATSIYNAGGHKATDGLQQGADIDALHDAQGLIQNIRVLSITTTSAAVNFHAPDSASACYIGYGTSTDPTTWSTTAANTSSSKERSITLSGLTAGTAYNYQVWCVDTDPPATQVFRTL